jgi:hypothetical protein
MSEPRMPEATLGTKPELTEGDEHKDVETSSGSSSGNPGQQDQGGSPSPP